MSGEIERTPETHPEDFEKVKPVEHLASMLKGTGQTTMKSAARAIVLRMPEHLLAEVDAMAKLAGKSRNSMTVHLLSAAIEELREAIDDETRHRLDGQTFENLTVLAADISDREQLEG